jgi:hypothetical protein
VQKRLVLVCGASLARNPRELPGVTGPSHGVVGVLHLVSELTLAVTRACAGQVCGHVARRGTWVGAGRIDMSNRESSWTGVDRRGRQSSKEG